MKKLIINNVSNITEIFMMTKTEKMGEIINIVSEEFIASCAQCRW